jgi:hypothetical protein
METLNFVGNFVIMLTVLLAMGLLIAVPIYASLSFNDSEVRTQALWSFAGWVCALVAWYLYIRSGLWYGEASNRKFSIYDAMTALYVFLFCALPPGIPLFFLWKKNEALRPRLERTSEDSAIFEEHIAFARKRIDEGIAVTEIKSQLIIRGVSPEQADDVIQQAEL